MKRLLFLTSLILPSALSAKPIAMLQQSGGFCPGQCPSTSLSIEDNGQVIVQIQKYVPTPSTERKVLLSLSKDALDVVQKDVRSIQPAILEMIDLDEDKPMCADIPMTTYTIVQSKQKIDIGYDRDCHKFRRS